MKMILYFIKLFIYYLEIYVIYLDEMPVKMSELIHIDRKAQSPLILMA